MKFKLVLEYTKNTRILFLAVASACCHAGSLRIQMSKFRLLSVPDKTTRFPMSSLNFTTNGISLLSFLIILEISMNDTKAGLISNSIAFL